MVRRAERAARRSALHPDDDRPRRSGARSDLRLRHDRSCRRAMGPALDHGRYLAGRIGARAGADHGRALPYYLLADSPEGQRKEGEVSRTPPKKTPTRGDIRQGFVYERVPHITLKSIANNAEIDVIWEKWQETLEPLRARLNAALSRVAPHPSPLPASG